MSGFYLFSAFGIPVSISPFYLLVLYMFGGGGLRSTLVQAVCITAALLVHEFGHALVARAYGLGPQVLLHGFGGLTAHQRAQRRQDEALIVASGPAAGLAFGLVTLAAALVLRRLSPMLLYRSEALALGINTLFFVNFGWSVVNLLPLWPLDGGQLYRLGMQKLLPKARSADRATHVTSLCLIGAVAVWMISVGSTSAWNLLILALLGWQNVSALRGQVSSGTVYGSHARGRGMLTEAWAALRGGNPREAARLCHQLRADAHLSAEQLGEVWALLGVSTAALGEHEEALGYLKRAPRTPEVEAATRECLVALGREQELQQVSAEQAGRRPRGPGRRWLWAVVVFDLVTMLAVILHQLRR